MQFFSSARKESIKQELQGTWISPNGKTKWIFNDDILIYEEVSSSGGLDEGAVSYTINAEAVVFRYEGIDSDVELEYEFENGVFKLFGSRWDGSNMVRYEYIKQ